MSEHGTRRHFQAGCRCVPCRAANAAYRAERAHAATPCLVAAAPARVHLRSLCRRGLGVKQLAALCGLHPRHLRDIQRGETRSLQPATAQAILRVRASDGSRLGLVRAGPTWTLVRYLQAEGYSHTDIARQLGYRHAGLQWNKHRIRVATALRVQRLYAKLTE